MTNAERIKQFRARKVAEGFCRHCLKRPATEGYKTCEECRQYRKKHGAAYRDKYLEYDTIRRANDLCVVYAILIAGFKYIGSTHAYEQRKSKHLSDLRLGKHSNKALQELYNEHGPDALEFVVLAELPKSTLKHDRLLLEQHFINQTPVDSCLNVCSACCLDEAA